MLDEDEALRELTDDLFSSDPCITILLTACCLVLVLIVFG
jgi:hypothetical protein